ncbi:hypothetical protein ACTXT7_014030 [Hymenolepis weldensis]
MPIGGPINKHVCKVKVHEIYAHRGTSSDVDVCFNDPIRLLKENVDKASRNLCDHISRSGSEMSDARRVPNNVQGALQYLNFSIFTASPVPPKMAPIQVEKITLPNKGPLSPTRGSDSLSDISSGVELNPHSPQIYGLGTRTNPYDLRSGVELHLICQTECGYPKAMPEWTVNNMSYQEFDLDKRCEAFKIRYIGDRALRDFIIIFSHLEFISQLLVESDSEPRKIESNRNVITQACDPRPQTRNMTTSTIPLKVQCEAFHLTGINKLRCAIAGTNDPAASKYVYILCSGVSAYTFMAKLISHMEKMSIINLQHTLKKCDLRFKQ